MNRRTVLKSLVVGMLSPLALLKEKKGGIYFVGAEWPDKNCFRYAILQEAIRQSQNSGTSLLMQSKCEFPGTKEELLVELRRLFSGRVTVQEVKTRYKENSREGVGFYAGYEEYTMHAWGDKDPSTMAWIIAVKLI